MKVIGYALYYIIGGLVGLMSLIGILALIAFAVGVLAAMVYAAVSIL